MANEIVWYHSDEVGAPTLNNVAGSLLGVLDACLITGFRLQTLTSVVVSSSVATATLSGHGYTDQMMVDIAGAGTAAVNGRKLITVTGANTFTFPVPGVGDSTITGTITAKRSPLGWERPAGLQGTNVAIYRRTDVTATSMLLRVKDDVSTGEYDNHARTLLLESATDVNTFVTATGQFSGGYYWARAANYSASASPWILVGDSKCFYLFLDFPNGSGSAYEFSGTGGLAPVMFGDFNSFRTGDAYACAIAGARAVGSGGSDYTASNLSFPTTLGNAPSATSAVVAARAADAIAPAVINIGGLGQAIGGPVGWLGPSYPSPVDNGLVFQREVMLVESNSTFNNPIRGKFRGLMWPLGRVGNRLHRTVLTSLVGFDGRVLCVAVPYSSGGAGSVAFDITGPWE